MSQQATEMPKFAEYIKNCSKLFITWNEFVEQK